MEAKDLLLADLEHFGESLLQNEQMGEKRFEFFVTVATAVIAGLVALLTSDNKNAERFLHPTAVAGAAGLLLMGVLTYIRMLHRNRITDEYKTTLGFIREIYKRDCKDLVDSSYKVPQGGKAGYWNRLTAGYAETVGVLNGVFAGALVALIGASRPWGVIGAVLGVEVATLLWICASYHRDTPRKYPSMYFRAGAGAVILDRENRVLTLERSKGPEAWQFPQGGLERGETAINAVLREIREETGIASVDLIELGEYPEPLLYVLPSDNCNVKTGMGQVQWWFFFLYKGADVSLPEKGEFLSAKWRNFDDFIPTVATFRRPVYERLRSFARNELKLN